MHITFVCTGNTCRSPMAEGIARKIIKEKYSGNSDITLSSAGTDAWNGSAASENSIVACKEIGVDISSHRSIRLTNYIMEKTDIFAVMTRSHVDILRYYGVPEENIRLLGGGIPDPFGHDLNAYRKCRDAIIIAIEELLAECVQKEKEVNE